MMAHKALDEISGKYELMKLPTLSCPLQNCTVSNLLLTEIEEEALSRVFLAELRKRCQALIRFVTSFDEFREKQQIS